MTRTRRFGVRVLLAGVSPNEGSLVRFAIDATRYGRCDTAELAFAIDRTMVVSGTAWFESLEGSSSDIILQICDLSDPAQSWTTLFHGIVDHVEWMPDTGCVTLECRDYLARLVDMRVKAAWLNLTGTELVEAVIDGAGLTPDVSFPAAMTGQFWQIEHKRSAVLAQHRFQTAFDLASFVAREAGCDLYADGTTIVCAPMPDVSNSSASVTDVSGFVLARSLSRDCQMASGIVVHVASWDSRQRTATEVYYDGSTYATQAPSGASVVHSFRAPGRRADEVRAIALQKYNRISAHAVVARVRVAGQPGLGPRQFLSAIASDGIWSGAMTIDAVRSHFSVETGFVQDVTVRKRSGDSL